jgi:indolepyruvate ferredoxin oxidoreductase alpha subunit
MAGRSQEVYQMLAHLPSGEQALAYGAWAAGVRVVTGYPGSPSSGTVKDLLAISTGDEVHVQWAANEKVAFETALGASLAGQRALVCLKSVGLNVALDPLMTANLTGVRGGLVILAGDDPGAWASQNEQDSRCLAAFAELPLLEPASPAEGTAMMVAAFDLSGELGIPVVVRETRDYSRQSGPVSPLSRAPSRRSDFTARGLEWVSLPFNVVANHRRLHERLTEVAAGFEQSPFNTVRGQGSTGIVAAGFAHAKVLQALPEGIPADVSLLKLGTVCPLPEEFLIAFLGDKRKVVVIEETEPFVEARLRALAQRRDLALDIEGKQTGYLPREGALTAEQIRTAISQVRGESLPPFAGTAGQDAARPSQQGLCEGCFYIPLFAALRDTLAELGRQAVVCADPGCSIRIHQPPFEMLHVKHCMGSAIGLASGMWLAGVDALPVALVGDSSFFHTGLNGLLSAVAGGAEILVLILDNGSAALTGGQPHPGSGRDARGARTRAVQLDEILRACGVDHLDTVDPVDSPSTRRALRGALLAQGLRVLIARGKCTRAGPS